MRLKHFIPQYISHLEKTKAPHTVESYKPYLFGALAHSVFNKSLRKLRLTDVDSIREEGKRHGKWGEQRATSVFRRFCKFIHDSGYKLSFDWRDIELPKSPPSPQIIFTPDELKLFFDSFEWRISNCRNCRERVIVSAMWALCETLFSTGARISEALSLTMKNWEEIQKQKSTQIIGKGNQLGIIYFTDRAIKIIHKYLEVKNEILKNKNYTDHLFVNSLGLPLTSISAKGWLENYRKQFTFKDKIKFHTFRRTLATMLIYNHADIKSTQTIMRHRSPRTTLRYYVITDDKKAEEVHSKLVSRFLARA